MFFTSFPKSTQIGGDVIDRDAAALLIQAKSTDIAALPALMFGGLGLFYASILGGIIMNLIEVILWLIVFLTLGFGIILLPFFQIGCMIWAMLSVRSHNKRLLARS